MNRISFLGLLSLFIVAAHPALAHHPSSISSTGTSGPIVTIPAATLDKGGLSTWLADVHVSFQELSNAVLEAAALNQEDVHSLASIESPTAGVSYGLTDRITLSLQLPYVIRRGIREGEHHHGEESSVEDVNIAVIDRGNSEGIGDLSFLGLYRFLGQDSGPQAALLIGTKTPTGKTNTRDNEGEVFETEFQPGSGSWDPLLGVSLTQGSGRWSLDANVLYTLATVGAQHTDLGDRFHYNGAISYRVIGQRDAIQTAHEHRHEANDHAHQNRSEANGLALDGAIEINGEWQAKQVISGETDPNSGGNVIYLSPGLRLSANDWSSFVSLGLPIVNNLNGKQSEPEYRLIGGGSVSF